MALTNSNQISYASYMINATVANLSFHQS